MWVPLSQTEMGKRDRKRKEREERDRPAKRHGRQEDPWLDGGEKNTALVFKTGFNLPPVILLLS